MVTKNTLILVTIMPRHALASKVTELNVLFVTDLLKVLSCGLKSCFAFRGSFYLFILCKKMDWLDQKDMAKIFFPLKQPCLENIFVFSIYIPTSQKVNILYICFVFSIFCSIL